MDAWGLTFLLNWKRLFCISPRGYLDKKMRSLAIHPTHDIMLGFFNSKEVKFMHLTRLKLVCKVMSSSLYQKKVLGTFFVCNQIAFCAFVATWLCWYIRRYWLIFKDPIESQHRVPAPWTYIFLTNCPLYSFTLINGHR